MRPTLWTCPLCRFELKSGTLEAEGERVRCPWCGRWVRREPEQKGIPFAEKKA